MTRVHSALAVSEGTGWTLLSGLFLLKADCGPSLFLCPLAVTECTYLTSQHIGKKQNQGPCCAGARGNVGIHVHAGLGASAHARHVCIRSLPNTSVMLITFAICVVLSI